MTLSLTRSWSLARAVLALGTCFFAFISFFLCPSYHWVSGNINEHFIVYWDLRSWNCLLRRGVSWSAAPCASLSHWCACHYQPSFPSACFCVKGLFSRLRPVSEARKPTRPSALWSYGCRQRVLWCLCNGGRSGCLSDQVINRTTVTLRNWLIKPLLWRSSHYKFWWNIYDSLTLSHQHQNRTSTNPGDQILGKECFREMRIQRGSIFDCSSPNLSRVWN